MAIYDLFRSRLDAMKGDWDDRRLEYQENYKQMLGMDIGQSKPWGAQVNSQHTHAQIMTATAFTVSGLIPTYPAVFAEMPEPWRELEPRAQEEYNHRLKRAGFYRFIYLWLRLAFSQKVGVAKLGFGPDGPQWNLVHPGNLMWDPSAENLRHDAEWVIEFFRRQSKRMMIAEFKQGLYTCSHEDFKKVIDFEDSDPAMQDQLREIRTGTTVPYQEDNDYTVSLYEMVEPEVVATIHEPTQVVLKEVPNELGYINYYDLSPFPESFEVEGYGIPDMARDIQDEINTLRRQRIDIRSLVANPMFKLLKGSGLDPFELVSAPGAVFPVNNIEDLSVLQVQDFSPSLQSEEGILVSDFDRLIGIHGQTRGESGHAGEKATVASIRSSNINVRLGVMMQILQDYPLRTFLADYVSLSALVEVPKAITIPEWELVRERAEADELWLSLHSEAYVGNAVEKFNMMVQLFQILANVTAPQGMAHLAKSMLSLVGVHDAEKITQFIVGNIDPDPVAAKQLPGPNEQGQGIPMVEESARASAPMQSGAPPMEMIPA